MTLRVSLGLTWGYLLQWLYGVLVDTAHLIVWVLLGRGYTMLCSILEGHVVDTVIYCLNYLKP